MGKPPGSGRPLWLSWLDGLFLLGRKRIMAAARGRSSCRSAPGSCCSRQPRWASSACWRVPSRSPRRGAGRFASRWWPLQEQLEILGRLDDGIWPFLNALSRALQDGQDPALALQEHQVRVLEAQRQLGETLQRESSAIEQEEALVGAIGRGRDERTETARAVESLLRWMELTEARARHEPERVPLAPEVEWGLSELRGVGGAVHRLASPGRARGAAAAAAALERAGGALRVHWDGNSGGLPRPHGGAGALPLPSIAGLAAQAEGLRGASGARRLRGRPCPPWARTSWGCWRAP